MTNVALSRAETQHINFH